MQVEFEDEDYARLERDPSFTAGLPPAVIKAFRKKLFFLRSAVDERDLRAMKSLHFEKLQGDRFGQHSIRLNSSFRLCLRLEGAAQHKVVIVVDVANYH